MNVVESGAFSGESSFFLGTAGINPLAPRLLLEMPTKKHRQGISQSQQFQNISSEGKSNHSTLC